MGYFGDGDNADIGFCLQMFQAEGFVQTQLAHTEILIKCHHVIHEFFHVVRLAKPSAEGTDAVTDALVEQLAVLVHIGVVADKGTAGGAKDIVKDGQVKVEQLLKYGEIVSCKVIDAAFYRAYDLTGGAEGIFVVDKEKSQIVVPEITGKAKGACHLYQLACALAEQLFLFL